MRRSSYVANHVAHGEEVQASAAYGAWASWTWAAAGVGKDGRLWL